MAVHVETPVKELEDILEEAFQEWVDLYNRSGKAAPEEYIVQRVLAHHVRETVEQRLTYNDGDKSRFNYTKRGNRDNPPPDAQTKHHQTSAQPQPTKLRREQPRGNDGGDVNIFA